MDGYKILTPEEVSELLKVGLKTVYRWINNGKLPASQLGGKTFRILERDLLLFLEQSKVKPKD